MKADRASQWRRQINTKPRTPKEETANIIAERRPTSRKLSRPREIQGSDEESLETVKETAGSRQHGGQSGRRKTEDSGEIRENNRRLTQNER